MKTEIVQPHVSNFIKSLRDIGYTFEVAVADIIDNSITASARNIDIHCAPDPLTFSILDDGYGMTEDELINAMRLASGDPYAERERNDLGKFGLGLKTASFSQAKELTVISKKNNRETIKSWDLDYISDQNEWLLITPNIEEYESNYLYEKLKTMSSGTLVIWRKIDTFSTNDVPKMLSILRDHLSLVFHRFIEGVVPGKRKLSIFVNNESLEAFNPFMGNYLATQELTPEKIKYLGSDIIVQPYILPHHSKLTPLEYEKYATSEGYTKSQGFYLYRANRLLIYGTWWGLHKLSDAHKLVRISVDIPNDQDFAWGIDIKKSTANPINEIKKELKSIIKQVTERGSRPYTGRGRKIEDKTTTRFWSLKAGNEQITYILNREHPLIKKLQLSIRKEDQDTLNLILMGIETYLPLDSIVANLNTNPFKVKQDMLLDYDEVQQVINNWREKGISEEFLNDLLKTELYKGKEN